MDGNDPGTLAQSVSESGKEKPARKHGAMKLRRPGRSLALTCSVCRESCQGGGWVLVPPGQLRAKLFVIAHWFSGERLLLPDRFDASPDPASRVA